MRAELAAAFMLLTRLPLGWLAGATPPAALADSVWGFPLVGAVVGAIGAAVVWACLRLGLPPPLAATWTLAAMVLATGALHEDGLADTADGFGGGRTRERKLEIMRDSRIGTFGALALILSVAARGTAIASIVQDDVAAALIASGALGRGAIVLVLTLLHPARTDGLASGLRAQRPGRSAIGLAFAAIVPLALLPLATGLAACGVALAVALLATWAARRQIGGYTGDVFGATSVLTECAVLTLLAVPFRP